MEGAYGVLQTCSHYIDLCDEIIENDGPQEDIDALMDEMAGFDYLFRTTRATSISSDRSIRGVRKLRGWFYAQAMSSGASQPPVVANVSSSSQATASSFMTMTSVVRLIDSCNLDQDAKEKLKNLADELERAKEGKDRGKAADVIAKWASAAKNSADAFKALIGAMQVVAPLFG